MVVEADVGNDGVGGEPEGRAGELRVYEGGEDEAAGAGVCVVAVVVANCSSCVVAAAAAAVAAAARTSGAPDGVDVDVLPTIAADDDTCCSYLSPPLLHVCVCLPRQVVTAAAWTSLQAKGSHDGCRWCSSLIILPLVLIIEPKSFVSDLVKIRYIFGLGRTSIPPIIVICCHFVRGNLRESVLISPL